MPIYEYRCERCGDFEEMQRITDPPLEGCPKCRRKVRRLISTTSFQLKGSGWYVTDYARAGNGKSKDAAGAKDPGSSESKTDGKGEAKSDAKTESKSESKSGAKPDTKTTAQPIRDLAVRPLDELRHMVMVLRASGTAPTELTPQPTLAGLGQLIANSGIETRLDSDLPTH